MQLMLQGMAGEKIVIIIFISFKIFLKKFHNKRFAIATSSCTAATHMGLRALGIKKNDEVILADTNWIAVVAPITYLGAKPVFVDIKKDTWCIDANKIEDKITKKTKAIIGVHLYGNLLEINKIKSICNKYNLHFVEDAAEALGSSYNNKKTGTFGDFSVFSFHGTKTITTGEGGMFLTDNEELYNKVLIYNNHGRSSNMQEKMWSDELGYKYKISNIQAALGYAQMKRINIILKRKREIFQYYFKNLSKIDGLSMNPEYKNTKNSFWMPNIVFDQKLNVSSEYIFKLFKKNNIDARALFLAFEWI
jgi:perosamine synthetase